MAPKRKAKINIDTPVIYAICDDITGKIVYIGQTKTPRKRSENYLYPNSCKNIELRRWLKLNKWHFRVLEKNPENLGESEKKWIAKHKGTLFNLNYGGDQNWRVHDRLPWMAGKMVLCPSDLLLINLKNRRYPRYTTVKKEISEIIKSMTVKERALFEVNLAMDFYEVHRKSIDKWLWYTRERLVLCLA